MTDDGLRLAEEVNALQLLDELQNPCLYFLFPHLAF